ncbi:hypothetical protein BDF22DRAFT_500621 [Syncephalis plumigaleata]|nr:hypothetical protein BDF22DRAFT_500621 [Syncephalis plumigaleata]
MQLPLVWELTLLVYIHLFVRHHSSLSIKVLISIITCFNSLVAHFTNTRHYAMLGLLCVLHACVVRIVGCSMKSIKKWLGNNRKHVCLVG